MNCERCLKPSQLCVCEWIRPVQARTQVLILQHPQEADTELGSAHLARLCLPHAHLAVGLSWPNLQRALKQQEPTDNSGHPDQPDQPHHPHQPHQRAKPRDWLVLYLGSAKSQRIPKTDPRKSMTDQPPSRPTPDPEAIPGKLKLVDRKGQPLSHPKQKVGSFKGLVVLDGSWSQAKTLWWRNAWLVKLQRAILFPDRPSLYQKLRREPRRASLSTIEAIALSLAIIENNPEILPALLAPFEQLLSLARRGGA